MREEGSPSDPADEFGGDTASEGGTVRMLTLLVVAVVAVGFFAVLGILNPPRDLGVRTDRLGPENAERVSDYLARAADSLADEDRDDHWALLSFTEPLPPDQLSAHAGGLRIGQVLYQVPIPRVRTPLTTIPVPANETAIRNSAVSAAGLMRSASTGDLSDERYRRILQVSADRLEAGCACAVAIVVRGPVDRLRELGADPAIRAVEALPADAVAGHYGVAPLLPEHTEAVVPGPDDGPVPAN
ncbi:hypothetical protein [Nocardia shimofusensis]|uniref:hypothetical protein n=1 Tax=Nocardia shimofusensis TaxID=228596 RepID=UPI000A9EE063|nr:hypothetical protein [Nocardia shimofusensis]